MLGSTNLPEQCFSNDFLNRQADQIKILSHVTVGYTSTLKALMTAKIENMVSGAIDHGSINLVNLASKIDLLYYHSDHYSFRS
jgi:hypothetical protein